MIHIANTKYGKVRGLTSEDTYITVFKGIPFAAPAVGENRWRVPQKPEKWEGIKDCFEFGPAGMQDKYTGDGFYDKEWHNDVDMPMSEDCLQLNIWTPAKTPKEKLPVMVWIFGGGLQGGHPAEMEFDGVHIASRGVVLVSVNYRTNVFGFMAHPEITAECGGRECTNFALFDQKAGIDWVYENIGEFGGDPENITIFGQSAGGRSVLCQLCSPLNVGGPIKRAISQSSTGINFAVGGHGTDYLILKEAEAQGEKFFEFMGVKTLSEARALDAGFVRDMGAKFRNSRLGQWQFVVDGCFLPGQIVDLLSEGRRLPVPVMTGSTTGEFFDVITAKTLEEFESKANSLYGEYAPEFLKLCDFESGDLSRVLALSKVNGSPFGARLLAMRAKDSGLPVWLYQFDPEIPGGDGAGVFHSSDLWFVFETLSKCWRPFVGKHYDLARQVCSYWTNFAKTGNPNGKDRNGTEMPLWNEFKGDYDMPMMFADDVHMSDREMPESIKGMYKLAADKLWRKK